MRHSLKYIVALSAVVLFYLTSRFITNYNTFSCQHALPYLDSEGTVNQLHEQSPFNALPTSFRADGNEQQPKDVNIPSDNLVLPEQENTSLPSCKLDNIEETQPRPRANAVIVVLCRNSELQAMRSTLREFEDRFNREYGYPYVFLNDEPFTDVFMTSIRALTKASVEFGQVPQEMWSVPSWVNETRMHESLNDYAMRNVLYGGLLSYRHMCRFNSGFFYRHPLLEPYEYYWRVEPGVSFFCDLDYDPFVFMQENNKKYSFTITLQEIPETIPTLWEHTLRFAHQHSINTTLLRMFGSPELGYNLCHFWSNFEIASLSLWRDARYQAYFDYLDKTGNFFYERWGDAIVHSLAIGLYLEKDQVHFFSDIGYKHDNFMHCIDDGAFGKCMCPERVDNFDYQPGSCLPIWNLYPSHGLQWDFLSNGSQIVDGGRWVERPDLVQ